MSTSRKFASEDTFDMSSLEQLKNKDNTEHLQVWMVRVE